MIRLRSQKLLSGVSTVAVLAALGVANPALATDQTATGPGLFPPIETIVTDTFILVETGAVVDEDALGNSITNTFDITQAPDTVDINASVLLGNIWNSGTFNSTTGNGIIIQANSNVLGGIVNSGGHILGALNGIEVNASNLLGGIQNTGAGSQIIGGSNGIEFTGDSLIMGGITNAGTIAGSANGIFFNDALIDFIGDITNTGRILSTGGTAAINLALVDTFVGDIDNSGLISGTGAAVMGVSLASGVFVGDITNSGTVSAVGTAAVAISLTGGTLTGDVSNSGLVLASGTGAAGLRLNGVFLEGTITNAATGIISAVGAGGFGIDVLTGTVTGGIANAGSILATGAGGIGVQVAADSFDGGIANAATGLISADATAILVSIATFTGDISNSGSILSAGADGIVLSGSILDGSITNAAGALIDADGGAGISVGATNFTITGDVSNAGDIIGATSGILLAGTIIDGSVSNTGSITATTGDGISWTGGTIAGDVTNGGVITAAAGTGVALNGTIIGGGVTNSGTITADNGIALGATGTITDDLTNSGTIIAATTGISVIGLVSGSLVNTGLIDPTIGINVTGDITGGLFNDGTIEGTVTGIQVTGNIAGGITNTGTITGETAGIDLDGAASAVDVTQTGGFLLGGEGGTGAIGEALTMNNTFAETFTASGGAVDGNITGDGTDDVLVDGPVAWYRGTGSSLDQFDVIAGTAVIGGEERGDEDGQGVTLGAATTTLTDGWIYVDDDTVITLSGALDASGDGGTIEWQLTPTTNGTIVAATADLGTDTRIAAYIDPATFASQQMLAGNPGTIVYQDVLDTGGLTGTFVNAGTIDMSSPFFTGVATDDGSNVDITITRNSFATALGLAGATQSANQTAMGGAFETMYLDGGATAQIDALFESLFGGDLTVAEIQAMFDDVAGAEYAQLQQSSIRTSAMFSEIVGQRLDQTLASEMGMATASLGGQRYAQVAVSASDAMGPAGGSHGLKRGPSGMSVWLRGTGQWANVDTDPEAAGYDQDSTGASGGLDYAVANNATIGLAGHWATTDIDFDTSGDQAEVDSWGAGVYGSYGFGRFYADGLFNYASHDIDATRMILPPVVGAPFVATSGYDATTWAAVGEIGMMYRLGRVNMQPSVGLSYTDLSTDGFTETGNAGAYSLVVQDADGQSFTSTVALRASGQWMMGRTPVIPEIRVGWRHEFEEDPLSFNAAFSDPVSPTFTIVSSEIQQDSAVVRAGFTAGVSRNFEVFFNVNGQYNSDASATNAAGGLRVTW